MGLGNHRRITLVTKIMVAVFGCVPAHDKYFLRGFRRVLDDHAKVPHDALTSRSLRALSDLYTANRIVSTDCTIGREQSLSAKTR